MGVRWQRKDPGSQILYCYKCSVVFGQMVFAGGPASWRNLQKLDGLARSAARKPNAYSYLTRGPRRASQTGRPSPASESGGVHRKRNAIRSRRRGAKRADKGRSARSLAAQCGGKRAGCRSEHLWHSAGVAREGPAGSALGGSLTGGAAAPKPVLKSPKGPH